MSKRYQRQIMLPEIGNEGQNKLLESRVLVVGVGGLGCPVLTYLVAAGIGKITIIDKDIISETNLNRQVLYGIDDVGKSKVAQAKKKLENQNEGVSIEAIKEELKVDNALDLVKKMDVVLDCTDNMATRYLLSDVCEIASTPLVFAGIHRFQGQITVFHSKNKISYRDLFPYDANKEAPSSCDENGVLGVVPGLLGTLQANEAIKIIAKFGGVLDGKMLVFNLLNLQSQIFKVKKTERATILQLVDLPEYAQLCSSVVANCISVDEFLQMDFNSLNLVDIRAEHEIPKPKLPVTSMNNMDKNEIVLICQTGVRSREELIEWKMRYPEKNIYSLIGGVEKLNKKYKA